MISRGLSELEIVHGFDSHSFHSCTVAGFSCTCGPHSTGGSFAYSYAGRMIDRLGLRANFNSVKPFITAHGGLNTSAESTAMYHSQFFGLGLEHSATTCSADFAELSTELWITGQPNQVVTTATSTSASFYTQEGEEVSIFAAGAMTSAATSSTSTGYSVSATYTPQSFPLNSANRYIRMVVAPSLWSTGCGTLPLMTQGGMIFGDPDETPRSSQRGRVAVTSACSS